MIYPSIDKLLTIVDSKYKLVHVASIRSKDIMSSGYLQMKPSEYVSKKAIGRSLEELEKGYIKIKEDKEKEE